MEKSESLIKFTKMRSASDAWLGMPGAMIAMYSTEKRGLCNFSAGDWWP